jgi:site-specific recombinase XerD
LQITKAVDDYLRHLQAEGRSPHTVAAYRRDLAAFTSFAIGESLTDLGQVTPADLVRFMASPSVLQDRAGRTRAPASINRYRVAVKALYAFAEARWLVERNPHGHSALPAASWAAAGRLGSERDHSTG